MDKTEYSTAPDQLESRRNRPNHQYNEQEKGWMKSKLDELSQKLGRKAILSDFLEERIKQINIEETWKRFKGYVALYEQTTGEKVDSNAIFDDFFSEDALIDRSVDLGLLDEYDGDMALGRKRKTPPNPAAKPIPPPVRKPVEKAQNLLEKKVDLNLLDTYDDKTFGRERRTFAYYIEEQIKKFGIEETEKRFKVYAFLYEQATGEKVDLDAVYDDFFSREALVDRSVDLGLLDTDNPNRRLGQPSRKIHTSNHIPKGRNMTNKKPEKEKGISTWVYVIGAIGFGSMFFGPEASKFGTYLLIGGACFSFLRGLAIILKMKR